MSADRTFTPETAPAGLRLPHGARSRHTLAVLAATVAGVLALVPAMPAAASAVLLIGYVGVAPGSALLAWTGPPGVSRLLLVPALGLATVIIVTAAAATAGWWTPKGLFAVIALVTLASVVPNVPELVRDMVPDGGTDDLPADQP